MAKEIEIYEEKDGFWAGTKKKDGTYAAGAHRMTDEEIMTMFTRFFSNYCEENGDEKLLMKDSEGQYFAAVRVRMEKPEEAAPEKPKGETPKKRGRRKKA